MTPQAMIQECSLSGVTVFMGDGKLKLKGEPEAVRVAADRLKPHKTAILKYLADPQALSQFRFDLVLYEIDAGHPAGDLHRVNNMAWEFMQADGMTFDGAIKAAAEIVASTQAAACEAAYTDVMALFARVKNLGGVNHA
jgi:hypothetical protein